MLGFCLLHSSSDLHIFTAFFCFIILWLERIQSKVRLIHICYSNISSRSEILSSWTVLLLKLTEVTLPRILSHSSKRAMYLIIYVHFHQIMPIRFRIKWYIFSMFTTACFHYYTNSWVDVDSVEFNSKKYSKITFFANKIYYNFIREYSNIINILNTQVRIGTLMLWVSTWYFHLAIYFFERFFFVL